jgi:WD40 repeat protein
MIFELAQDFHEAVAAMPGGHPKHQMLGLLEEAIRRDIHFIARHPRTLFQCMWNTCWWYDCPEAAKHYVRTKRNTRARFLLRIMLILWRRLCWTLTSRWRTPRRQESVTSFCLLLESWRAAKEEATPSFPWLRALRPPELPLGHGQTIVLRGHHKTVNSLAYSPDGSHIVSGSKDGTIRFWDTASGQELRCCLLGNAVRNVSFSSDGMRILSSSLGGRVRLWDAATGQQLCCLQTDGDVAALSPDGSRIVVGTSEGEVQVWNAHTGIKVGCWRGHTDGVHCVSFSPDGILIATGSQDKTAGVWATPSGRELCRLLGHTRIVGSVAFAPDGSRIASGSWDGSVRLWDAVSGEELRCLQGHGSDVLGISFSPDGSRIASVSGDRTIRVWDVATGKELKLIWV